MSNSQRGPSESVNSNVTEPVIVIVCISSGWWFRRKTLHNTYSTRSGLWTTSVSQWKWNNCKKNRTSILMTSAIIMSKISNFHPCSGKEKRTARGDGKGSNFNVRTVRKASRGGYAVDNAGRALCGWGQSAGEQSSDEDEWDKRLHTGYWGKLARDVRKSPMGF